VKTKLEPLLTIPLDEEIFPLSQSMRLQDI
jgi:hypothetical protein